MTLLPKIDKPLTATQLRDRVLRQLNGESRDLSRADQERRRRLLKQRHKGGRSSTNG
jgi:hypothetical protein